MKRNNFIKSLLGLPFVLPLLSNTNKNSKEYRTKRRIWKPEDIKAGLYISACSRDIALATVTFQIGYNLSLGRMIVTESLENIHTQSFIKVGKINRPEAKYTLNSVADGWCHGDAEILKGGNPFMGYTKQSLCDMMNSDYRGYRPTTKAEMVNIVNYVNKNYL